MSELHKGQKPQSYNYSLEKSLTIVDALLTASNNEYMSIVNIKKLTNYNNATIYRILNTFYLNGYVEKNEHSKYRLGYKFIIVAGKILSGFHLRDRVRPYLVKITEKTKLFSFLSIVYENNVVLIDKVNTDSSLQASSEIGSVYPLNVSATGKFYLSYLGEDKVREIYKDKKLERMTSHSITDINKLIEEINKIKELGYSIANEETHMHRITITVPIFDLNRKFIASIGVSAFSGSISEEEKNSALETLKHYGKEISSQII